MYTVPLEDYCLLSLRSLPPLPQARRWWPGGRKKRIADALGTDALPGSGWGEAYRLAEEGLQLEGRMQVEEAARVFERVVALDPKNAPFVAR